MSSPQLAIRQGPTTQSMGRVGNRKSRKGCIRCKSRRVKCDELRPACGWCVSHGMLCEYPEQIRYATVKGTPMQATQHRSEDHSDVVDTPHVASPTFLEANRPQLEMGLFQYYCFTVARTFPFDNTERGLQLHSDVIPQASLRCSNLLNVLYAYALLHMHIQSAYYDTIPRNTDFFEDLGVRMRHTQTPGYDGKVDLLTLHMEYLSTALQGQRDIVSQVNHKNADGICIAAMLLAQVALVHSAQVNFDEFYSIPADWFRLQASFSTCLIHCRPLLSMDSATSMLIHSTPSIDNQDLDRHVPTIFKDLCDWQPEDGPEWTDNSTREIYRICVAYIETVYRRIAGKEGWHGLGRRLLAFPNICGLEFLTLLEEHKPRALVILAHVLAMMKRVELQRWVFREVSEYHVRGIGSMIPDEWKWAMEWPLRVLDTGAADECFQSERTAQGIVT